MNGKLSWSIFWALIGVFIVIVCLFLIPPSILRGYIFWWFLIIFGSIFLLLGVALIVLTVREKVSGTLKKFFLLTGASSVGFLVFVLLHNAVYALFIHFFGEGFWDRIGGDEPVFFIMAIFVCPLGFLVGAIGSIWLWSVLEPKDAMNAKGAQIPTAWFSIVPIARYFWWWKFCKGVEMVTDRRMSAVGAFCLVFFTRIIGTIIIRVIFRDTLSKVAI